MEALNAQLEAFSRRIEPITDVVHLDCIARVYEKILNWVEEATKPVIEAQIKITRERIKALWVEPPKPLSKQEIQQKIAFASDIWQIWEIRQAMFQELVDLQESKWDIGRINDLKELLNLAREKLIIILERNDA